ncbi:Coproporphyrinogen III oxidase, oxygen-independent [hydrothermal vent metagenome]|uniref:Oxygen-independent coproporphyrinogen III oxidase n=1 Tax=hydrothermal vent metagenome TaxID=652676 RepID=A0A3B1AXQ6_9ZZZZ
MSELIFDTDLIRRYDKAGPRYTSYPTAVQFHTDFTADDYKAQLEASNATGRDLSLYFHIPFCDTICFFCGCNKIATKDRSRAEPYLRRVYKELEMQSALIDPARQVRQLHWGGGTPTFISHDEMRELMNMTRKFFTLADDSEGEYSIEIDPREATAETIKILREVGFNRMSLGVQDFDPAVQKAVNRIQPEEQTYAVIEAARKEGFHSVSLDLIYGLPHQSMATFSATLEKVLEMNPDRLSVFNYAHLPEMFKPQRRINEADLPSADEKLAILKNTIDTLIGAGYVYIGMDHFAKPDDELAIAQANGLLYRNFQGYSTHADCDLVALGVTSIGKVGDCFAQNFKPMDDYTARIDNNELAIFRGFALSADDRLRQEVINQLICNFVLNFAEIENKFNITFADYFAVELDELKIMKDDGLIDISAENISVSSAGKLLIRNICMVFDIYLRNKTEQRFSKVI